MSRENVETIRAGYDALNRGDHEAWLSTLHPEIELHDLAIAPETAVYRGRQGVRRWIESVWEVGGGGGDVRFEPEELTEAGGFVIVSVRASMFGRGSAKPVEGRRFHVIEMTEGQARRIWAYQTEDEALEAVGLRE